MTNKPKVELHLGDCLEFMRTMPDKSVDAVITDPPYFRIVNNAWEHSQVADWKDENEKLTARNKKLEEFVNELIEAGYAMLNSIIDWTYEEPTPEADKFCELAKDWKEG